jgi:hypothetical protein
MSLTLLVVAPVVIAVDGVWGGYLADGGDASAPLGASLVSVVVSIAVVPPLVTALHVVVVQGLARGEEPSIGGALAGAAGRLLPAIAAVLLYSVALIFGFVALIVPGIWLAVRWYFCAQAAVVDRLGPAGALRRSAELVDGRWWRTFGVLAAFNFITGTFGAIAGQLIRTIDNGVAFLTCSIVVQTITLSLTAIFGTLLFFDLRARSALPWQGTSRLDALAPERPVS